MGDMSRNAIIIYQSLMAGKNEPDDNYYCSYGEVKMGGEND